MAKLGFNLAKHLLLRHGEKENVVFSPLSIRVLLSLITVGSNGPTRDQLLSFLQFNTINDLNSCASKLFALLFSDDSNSGGGRRGPHLSFSNGVWVDKFLSVKPSFSQVVETTYKSTVASIDFQNKDDAAKEINSWAKKETNSLINAVVTPDSLNFTDLILANTIYFKGSWIRHTFDASQTSDSDFHLFNGGTIKVPFMTGSHIRCAKAFDGFKVLRLPYEKNPADKHTFHMYIFLPNEKDGLPDLVEKGLPCHLYFDLEFDKRVNIGKDGNEMVDLLISVLLEAFREKYAIYGDLDWIVELDSSTELFMVQGYRAAIFFVVRSPVHVSEIIHKSFIKVNEEGTEAAAVSAASFFGCCLQREEPIDFVADHPFLFLIREHRTGTILFIGQVLNPLGS